MTSYFSSLAVCAFPGPSRTVRVHVRPDKFSGDDLLGSMNSRMAESVEGVENAATPIERDEGASHSV